MNAPSSSSSSADSSISREEAKSIVARLRENGHIAYFAGGCVRDLLLGQSPKDYDVATDAPPNVVRKLFPRTQAVGAAFGVILVRMPRTVVEVATFRTDGTYTDGRHPSEVTFTTAEHDAQRRDFTINGLFLDPLDNDRIIDFVGGVADLNARIIRAIGDPKQRFAEDHLRILRAIRFSARLGFEIESKTWQAMQEETPHLIRISPERIADELRRMLIAPTAWRAMSMLRGPIEDQIFRFDEADHRDTVVPPVPENASVDRILPTAPSAQRGTGFPPVSGTADSGGSNLPSAGSRKASIPPVPGPPSSATSFPLALAMLWTDRHRRTIASESFTALFQKARVIRLVKALRQSLRLSNEETDELAGILSLDSIIDRDWTIAKLKRFLARPTSRESVELLHLLALRSEPLRDFVQALDATLAPLDGIDPAPMPLITGDDLTAAGFNPGKAFKTVLDETYDGQLEDRFIDKPSAVAWAIERMRQLDAKS